MGGVPYKPSIWDRWSDLSTDAPSVVVERCGVLSKLGVIYTLLGFGSLAGEGDCNLVPAGVHVKHNAENDAEYAHPSTVYNVFALSSRRDPPQTQ